MMNRLRIAASFLVVCIGSLVMLGAALLTGFSARRFYSEVIGRAIGTAVLRLWGVRIEMCYLASLPPGQAVFISNHQSTLDVFVLIAMALPRMRFFLSGYLRRVIPLGIIGYLIRVFWTVPQQFPAERRRIFARADRILRHTGDSVYLSPEGMRVTGGEIGAFNKGSIHLATSLRAPIVPLYFRIPPAVDPGRGYVARPGVIEVYVLPPIPTRQWRLADVAANRDRVRDLYCRIHAHLRATGTLPAELTPPAPVERREAVLA